jgi:hypothetical protein
MTLSNTSETLTTTTPSNTERLSPRPVPLDPDVPRAVFAYDLDDVTYEYDHPSITGTEVMVAGGIPISEGITRILPDGTRESVAPDTVIDLATGAQFRRRPRFKRG